MPRAPLFVDRLARLSSVCCVLWVVLTLIKPTMTTRKDNILFSSSSFPASPLVDPEKGIEGKVCVMDPSAFERPLLERPLRVLGETPVTYGGLNIFELFKLLSQQRLFNNVT